MLHEGTLGQRIAARRRELGFTQEDMAEGLGVSSQAVSKWENDVSCPDIKLLPALAEMLETTLDELLSEKPQTPAVRLLSPDQRKDPQDMMLYVRVQSSRGDSVKVNIPLPLAATLIEAGIAPQIQGGNDNLFKGIDWNQLLSMANSGVVGKLVEVKSADGDIVEITVE